jgi:hypothetical protein
MRMYLQTQLGILFKSDPKEIAKRLQTNAPHSINRCKYRQYVNLSLFRKWATSKLHLIQMHFIGAAR